MTTNNAKGIEMNEKKYNAFELVCFAVIGASVLIALNATVWGLCFGF